MSARQGHSVDAFFCSGLGPWCENVWGVLVREALSQRARPLEKPAPLGLVRVVLSELAVEPLRTPGSVFIQGRCESALRVSRYALGGMSIGDATVGCLATA